MNATPIEQTLPSDDDPEIAEIRSIRAAISAECDHDPWKLVARMRAFEAKYHPPSGDAVRTSSSAFWCRTIPARRLRPRGSSAEPPMPARRSSSVALSSARSFGSYAPSTRRPERRSQAPWRAFSLEARGSNESVRSQTPPARRRCREAGALTRDRRLTRYGLSRSTWIC